jgi:hypothetical protein
MVLAHQGRSGGAARHPGIAGVQFKLSRLPPRRAGELPTGLHRIAKASGVFGPGDPEPRSNNGLSVRCCEPGGVITMPNAAPSARTRLRRIASTFSASIRASRAPISSAN